MCILTYSFDTYYVWAACGFTLKDHGTHRFSVTFVFCRQDLPSGAKAFSFTSFEVQSFLLWLNKGFNSHQSAFWIWITKQLSLVCECDVLSHNISAMLYHTGPSSLVFFVGCYIITDRDSQIQNYKNKLQLKLKLHQLWKIASWLSKLQLVFLKKMWHVLLTGARSSSL